MKRTVVSVFVLFLAVAGFAQVTERQFDGVDASLGTYLNITVKDKATSKSLPGATVFLSKGKDTLKTVTDNSGKAIFEHIPFKKNRDTLVLSVSFLGFKDVEYRHPLKRASFLTVQMEEDPEQINEIIVKGEQVVMVTRGDTTIYNTSAFTTMQGDNLAELLKKMPGITMNEGQLCAQGRPVSKILINGTTLFGSDIVSAMTIVQSDDVKKIRVYDEYDQDRLAKADTVGMKERVLDVETKKPVRVMQNGELSAMGGVFLDKDKAGKYDFAAGAGGLYQRFSEEGLRINSTAGLGHNYESSAHKLSSSPEKNAIAMLSISDNKKFRYKYSNSVNFMYGNRASSDYSKLTYTPNEYFQEKVIETDNVSESGNLSASYSGSFGKAFGERQSLEASVNIAYRNSRSRSGSPVISVTDGIKNLSDVIMGQSDYSYSVTGSIEYGLNFKKTGRRLSIGAKYLRSENNGTGERTDTLPTSTSPQWLVSKTGAYKNGFEFSTGYEEPLAGKNFRMSFGYRLSGDFSKEKKYSVDELLDRTDSISSYDFTRREIVNVLNAGFVLRNTKNNLNLKLTAEYTSSARMRKEVFPARYDYPRIYHHISPRLVFNWFSPKCNIAVTYSENQSIPSEEQTRPVVDYSSPLFLVAGNPALKQGISRVAIASANLSHSSNNWQMRLIYMDSSNGISNKRTYFKEDTYLEEYDYTAVAGSQLSLPVNVNGNRSGDISLQWSGFINPISTSISCGPVYAFRHNPFYTEETLHKTKTNSLSFNLSLDVGFSRYFQASIYSTTSIGRNSLDDNKVYDFVNESLIGSVRVNFLKRLWLDTDVSYTIMRTDGDSAPGYDDLIWNAGISSRLGKNQQFELGLVCNDILNSRNPWSIIMTDDYIQTGKSSIFGRSLVLSFKYSFR